MGYKELEELGKLRRYTERKFKELNETLTMLIEFARDDLKRLDEFKKRL